MTCSIVIATYNRAADLRETLASLAQLQTTRSWEVIVVDNNSPDDTKRVVQTAASAFPVPLRYVFEREQGRSPALNAGIRIAAGGVIVTTDDDVRVERDWLDRAVEGLERLDCDYVGGRVLPIWGGKRPGWLPNHGGKQWAVIALLDYGPDVLEFGNRVPLGVNMAFRRSAFERAGVLDPSTGRKAGTLLGQEVREWCIRARGRCAGLLRARDDRAPHHSRSAPEEVVLPAMVLLARRQPGAPVRAIRAGYGSAGADHARFPHGPARDRRAAVSLPPRDRARRCGRPRHHPPGCHGRVRARTVALVFCGYRRAAVEGPPRRPDQPHAAPGGVTMLRRLTPVIHKIDDTLARMHAARDVLFELRTPVYHAVLGPVADALSAGGGVRVWYTSESPDRIAPLLPDGAFLTHRQVEWRHFDLYANGDPWAAARLRRCSHRIHCFHGGAGLYALDGP
jgi:GT2 family glycosyltransferase